MMTITDKRLMWLMEDFEEPDGGTTRTEAELAHELLDARQLIRELVEEK